MSSTCLRLRVDQLLKRTWVSCTDQAPAKPCASEALGARLLQARVRPHPARVVSARARMEASREPKLLHASNEAPNLDGRLGFAFLQLRQLLLS
jgi:hypothetical protein